MKKIKEFLLDHIPIYGWAAIFVIVSLNLIVYYGTTIITDSLRHYDIASTLDKKIPFVPSFIIVYIVVAYAQWWFGYYTAAREDKKTVLYVFGAESIAKILCMIIFFVFPTTMERGEIIGTDLFSRLVTVLYKSDSPCNLFPSIHCLESYLLWRTLPQLKKAPHWYKCLTPFVTVMVFASVLLVKQHAIADILGAILVTEIGVHVMTGLLKIDKQPNLNAILFIFRKSNHRKKIIE